MFGRIQTTTLALPSSLSRSTALEAKKLAGVPHERVPSPKADCVSVVEYTVIEEEKEHRSIPKPMDGPRSVPFEMMKKSLLKMKEYPTRLSSTVALLSLSSGLASLKVSWDPTSLTSFADFALLFSQYRVRKVSVILWFADQQSVSTQVGPTVFLIGADPGMAISTPTATNVSDLSRREYLNPLNTNKNTSEFTCSAREVPLALDPAGFLDVTSSWTGQTCAFAQATASSTAPVVLYQVVFDVLFRNRF